MIRFSIDVVKLVTARLATYMKVSTDSAQQTEDDDYMSRLLMQALMGACCILWFARAPLSFILLVVLSPYMAQSRNIAYIVNYAKSLHCAIKED